MKIIKYSIALGLTALLIAACSNDYEDTNVEENIDTTPQTASLPEFSEKFDFIQGNDLRSFDLGQGFDTDLKKNLETPLNTHESTTFSKRGWRGVSRHYSSPNPYSKSDIFRALALDVYDNKVDAFRGFEELYFISNPKINDYIENLDFENSLSVLISFQSRNVVEIINEFTYTESAKKLFEEDEAEFYDTYGDGFVKELSYGINTFFLLHVNVHEDHPLSLEEVRYALRQKMFHINGDKTLEDEELAEIDRVLSSKGIKITRLLFSNVDNPSINEIRSYEEFYNILENDSEKIFDSENIMYIKVSFHDIEK